MEWVACSCKPQYELTPAENDIDTCVGTGRNICYILCLYTNTTLVIKKIKKAKTLPRPSLTLLVQLCPLTSQSLLLWLVVFLKGKHCSLCRRLHNRYTSSQTMFSPYFVHFINPRWLLQSLRNLIPNSRWITPDLPPPLTVHTLEVLHNAP